MANQRENINPKEFFRGVLLNDETLLFDITEDIIDLGVMIGNNMSLFRGIYQCYRQLEANFSYIPPFGNPLMIEFAYDKESVNIDFRKKQLIFTMAQFIQFLGKVDMTFAPIYPLGTIVELDETMFPEGLEEIFTQDNQLGARVMLSGRKVPLPKPFDSYIIDYEASLWPFGYFAGQPPILVSNMMIKKVISMGYTDEYEEQFSFDVLRASQVIENKASTAFMTDEDGEAFAQLVEDTLSNQLEEE